jgi:hypothetical protein
MAGLTIYGGFAIVKHNIRDYPDQQKAGYSGRSLPYPLQEAINAEKLRVSANPFQETRPPKKLATGDSKQGEYVDAYEIQIELLRKKGCGCNV